MTTFTEKLHTGGFLLSEADGQRSRENGIVASGADLGAGTVLGQILAAAAAVAVGTPTGNGVITVGAIGADVQPGVYQLVLITAASNAGTFNYYAPDGSLIRQVTVGGGAAASPGAPTVTIADGSSDFVAGDTFTITVTGGKYKALTPAGTDGSQVAVAILYAPTFAASADVAAAVIARAAEVIAAEIVWPAGITVAQQTLATFQLASRGIILR